MLDYYYTILCDAFTTVNQHRFSLAWLVGYKCIKNSTELQNDNFMRKNMCTKHTELIIQNAFD